MLYAVGEVDNARGKRAGAVLAYAIEPQTGRLTLLNEETSGAPGRVIFPWMPPASARWWPIMARQHRGASNPR